MRAIDLFAGAGGLSLGLRQAGIDVVAAIERDADSCATYRANLGDHMIQSNIEDVDAHSLPDCELIAGGPPCQGFSYAGKRDKDDPRNQLWREYWRIVEAKRPAWVLIENVRGMLTMGEDKPLILAFREIGYEITPYLLNAADYGVPQRRLRVFYIGNRLGLANPCPAPTHAKPPQHLLLGLQPWVTVRQALGIGPEPIRHRIRGRASGDGNGQTFDDPAPTIPAQWSVDVVDPARGQRIYTDSDGRQHMRPSNGAILRRLTVRECADFQSFPKWYEFHGSKTSRYRQVGNAVAVVMARALGEEIRRAAGYPAICRPVYQTTSREVVE